MCHLLCARYKRSLTASSLTTSAAAAARAREPPSAFWLLVQTKQDLSTIPQCLCWVYTCSAVNCSIMLLETGNDAVGQDDDDADDHAGQDDDDDDVRQEETFVFRK